VLTWILLDFVPTIPDRYNKYAVLPHASDDSTSEAGFLTIDEFRDSVATSFRLCGVEPNIHVFFLIVLSFLLVLMNTLTM
jgi:hypothetical protein